MSTRIVTLNIQVEVPDDEDNEKLNERLDWLLADMEELASRREFDIYNTFWEDL